MNYTLYLIILNDENFADWRYHGNEQTLDEIGLDRFAIYRLCMYFSGKFFRRRKERKCKMHFVVIGTGGIGGYYGARLQANGQLVTFIARGAHLQVLQTRGLRVNHPAWRFDAPVRACSLEQFLQSSSPSEADLIILCVKATDTEAIARHLADRLGGLSTPVLSLQNGVDNEAVLTRHLGAEKVLGGLAVLIGSHLTAPGIIDAVGPAQVVMGQWPTAAASSNSTKLLERLAAVFNEAGIPTRVTDNIQLELWRKLVINNGMNPLSALTLLDTGTLMHDPGLSQIVYGLMAEATIAAAADGVSLTETDCREMFELVRRFDPIKTSMLVDFEHHRPLELEEICGAVLSRSRQLQREAPYTFTIYQLLRLAASRMS
ncbi:MAG: ketopantoate reductase family protein [Syntrophobacteraceae bacterium]